METLLRNLVALVALFAFLNCYYRALVVCFSERLCIGYIAYESATVCAFLSLFIVICVVISVVVLVVGSGGDVVVYC